MSYFSTRVKSASNSRIINHSEMENPGRLGQLGKCVIRLLRRAVSVLVHACKIRAQDFTCSISALIKHVDRLQFD